MGEFYSFEIIFQLSFRSKLNTFTLLLTELVPRPIRSISHIFGRFTWFFRLWIFFWVFWFTCDFCLLIIQVSFTAEYFNILYLLLCCLSLQDTALSQIWYCWKSCTFWGTIFRLKHGWCKENDILQVGPWGVPLITSMRGVI